MRQQIVLWMPLPVFLFHQGLPPPFSRKKANLKNRIPPYQGSLPQRITVKLQAHNSWTLSLNRRIPLSKHPKLSIIRRTCDIFKLICGFHQKLGIAVPGDIFGFILFKLPLKIAVFFHRNPPCCRNVTTIVKYIVYFPAYYNGGRITGLFVSQRKTNITLFASTSRSLFL